MGDRGTIKVFDGGWGEAVFLYSHWGGSGLAELVHSVLSRKQRWDDSPYLARMLFSAMVKGDVDGETGFGISAQLCEAEHPVIVIDSATQTIGLTDSDDKSVVLALVPLAEFVKDPAPLFAAYRGQLR